jgi:hypothetical protein
MAHFDLIITGTMKLIVINKPNDNNTFLGLESAYFLASTWELKTATILKPKKQNRTTLCRDLP